MGLCLEAPSFDLACPCGLNLQYRTFPFLQAKSRCYVHLSLGKPPQPIADATGAGVPERKIGPEALEASAKLRKSDIDCLSAASFEAARSERLRLPAEGPLKRRDSGSCKSA